MSTPRYILLVDDDAQVIEVMKRALAKDAYEVAAVTSGYDALEAISNRRPDLVVLDLSMPKPDGFDIIKVQRQEHPYLKLLVVSGYLQGPLLDAAKFFGAIATIQKPFTATVFAAKVREALGA